jgi:hypothetical protein
MPTLRIEEFGDRAVIHIETEGNQLNAYTLASMLVGFADAAKAANNQLNPGYDVEVVVEAVGPGSFRAQIRTLYRKHKNLFSQQVLLGLVVGILGNYIYERTLSKDDSVKVIVNTDEVVIQNGDKTVVVPRRVYDATRVLEKDPKFTSAISRTFEALDRDPKVEGVGLVENIDSPKPEILIPKSHFAQVVTLPEPEPDHRVITEVVELQIIKAILDRGNRKWEFMWRGIRISAPVLHEEFWDRFVAHKITIAPGDVLTARLAIKQVRENTTGIYSNEAYEVIEVFEHIPRPKQTNFL